MTIELSELPQWVFPLLAFCLGVFFLTLFIRKAVEGYLTAFAARPQWKKVWLPSLPPLFGGIAAAVMHKYPFLCTLPTWGTRFIYGCVAGGLSSFFYKIVKAVIVARLGVKVSDDSMPPGPNDAPTLPAPRDDEEPTDPNHEVKP